MRLPFQRSPEKQQPPVAETPQYLPPEGEACSDASCSERTGVQCSYRDWRGNRCGTSWCPRHRLVIRDVIFCRRHGNTIEALGNIGPGVSLPDTSNRAPSLVHWVSRSLEVQIMSMLQSHMHTGSRQTVGTTAVHLTRPADGSRVWVRKWKLSGSGGPEVEVAIEVVETQPANVVIRVGADQVASSVPPWVARREEGGESIDADADDRERRGYFDASLRAIQTGISQHLTQNRNA